MSLIRQVTNTNNSKLLFESVVVQGGLVLGCSSSSSRSSSQRVWGKARYVKRHDGDVVTKGTILARQLGLDFLPGLNAGIGRDRTVYARVHGRVFITTEQVNPNWTHKIVKRFRPLLQENESAPIYKTYFHVLAEPQTTNFRLVDQI